MTICLFILVCNKGRTNKKWYSLNKSQCTKKKPVARVYHNKKEKHVSIPVSSRRTQSTKQPILLRLGSCDLSSLLITGFPSTKTAAVASLAPLLAINDVTFSSKHLMRNIDFGTFTFLVSIFAPFPLSKTKNIPVNHLCASTTHQIMTASIGAPHTRHVQFIKLAFKSLPVTLGRHKIGIISDVKHVARVPTTGENFPKCQGPGRNRLPTRNVRMVIGIVKATKAAIAAMLKIAPIAMRPPNIRKVRQMPMTVLNQTALTGVCVCLLTLFQMRESGKQSSRA